MQVSFASLNQIEETTWAGNNDVRTLNKFNKHLDMRLKLTPI